MNDDRETILIISINSPYELTGGGHYLRCLINGYCDDNYALTILGKDCKKNHSIILDDVKEVRLFSKTKFADLFSRLFLCPSFLFLYTFEILKYSRDYNFIALHSSRLGLLALIMNLILSKKKIITHFDNNEAELIKERLKGSSFSIRFLLNIVEYILVFFSEKLAVAYSSQCTFITRHDAKSFGIPDSTVIPICFNTVPSLNFDCNKKKHIVFTGSYDFEPNIIALREYIHICKNNPLREFVVAGRSLDTIVETYPNNLTLISDPSIQEMEEVMNEAYLYISPVRHGSGMKTKIAEAMSYGLPIITTKHSLIGYEKLDRKGYIFKYEDIQDISESTINNLVNAHDYHEVIYDYNELFTYQKAKSLINNLLSSLH